VSNKALSSNEPVIFSITATVVNAGDTITGYGQNFAPRRGRPPVAPLPIWRG